jgi:hypothetical protein
VAVSGVVERCSIQSSTSACYYQQNSSANGAAVNSNSSITYTNIPAIGVTPTTDALATGLCGATATFSVTGTHIVQSSTNRTVTLTN